MLKSGFIYLNSVSCRNLLNFCLLMCEMGFILSMSKDSCENNAKDDEQEKLSNFSKITHN